MEQPISAEPLRNAVENAAYALLVNCLDCEGFRQNKCAAAALSQKLGTIMWSEADYTQAILTDAAIMTRGIDDTIARLVDFDTRVRSCTGWAFGRKAFTAGRSMVESGNGMAVLYLDDTTRTAAKLANDAIGWQATETTVVLQACSNQRHEDLTSLQVNAVGERDAGDVFVEA